VSAFLAPRREKDRRKTPIGLRMAVGAQAWRIRGQVIAEGLRPVLVGLVIGFAAGALIRRALQPFFQRFVPTLDVPLLLVVPALFVAFGLAACFLPARRATRIEPVVALRQV
jgi:putative ABC transport system permease protein